MKEVCSPTNTRSAASSKLGSPNLGLSPGCRSDPGNPKNPNRGADSVPAQSTGGAYPVGSHSTDPGATTHVTGPDALFGLGLPRRK
jgi:hypothetical protein